MATFIDFEHFIIPDEITLGGAVAGFVISFFLPSLHHVHSNGQGMVQSVIGIAAGAGIVYGVLRGGKLLFGRQKIKLPAETTIVFSETALCLPDKEISYEEIFYRQSDTIVFHARTLELVDRGYANVRCGFRRRGCGLATRRSSRKRWLTWRRSAPKSCCRARRWGWAM